MESHTKRVSALRMERHSVVALFSLLGIVLVTVCLYYPAKDGPLVLDDQSSIVGNSAIKVFSGSKTSFVDAAYSMNKLLHSDSVVPKRPISYISFALNFYFAEDILAAFKLTNIALHIAAGLVVYLLTLKLVQLAHLRVEKSHATGLALLVTFMWLTHPLFVSTVLYVTQRMAILSALFTFLAVYSFIVYRQAFLAKNSGLLRPAVFLGTCTLVAYFSKENGALIPFFCLVVEGVFFRFQFHPATTPLKKVVYVGMLVIPSVCILGYLANAYHYHLSHPPISRLYSIDERLLTELRVLWQYVSTLLLIDPDGIRFWHDDIQHSSTLFQPVSTFSSLLAWVAVVGVAAVCVVKNRQPLVSFGLLWFLVGHLIESTTLDLELAFEHRNYGPGYGVIFLAVYGLFSLLKRVFGRSGRALWACLLVCSVVPVLTYDYAQAWKDKKSLAQENYARAPESPRAIAHWVVFEEDDDEKARLHAKIRALTPREAGHRLFDIAVLCQQNRTIPSAEIDHATKSIREGVPTITTSLAFREVIRQCDRAEYDSVLTPVYEALTSSRYTVLAANGWLMLAHVQRRLGNHARYWALFQRAKSTAMTFDIQDELTKNAAANDAAD